MILVLIITGCSKPTNKEVAGQENQSYVIKIGHAAAKEHFVQGSFEKFNELSQKSPSSRNEVSREGMNGFFILYIMNLKNKKKEKG